MTADDSLYESPTARCCKCGRDWKTCNSIQVDRFNFVCHACMKDVVMKFNELQSRAYYEDGVL